MTSQLKPATIRHMIDLAQHATDKTAPALFALYDNFLAPALVEFERIAYTDPDRENADRVMLCFVAGMLAANPAFVLMGAPPEMVRQLGEVTE